MDYFCSYCGQKFTRKVSLSAHEVHCKKDEITQSLLQERKQRKKINDDKKTSLEVRVDFVENKRCKRVKNKREFIK